MKHFDKFVYINCVSVFVENYTDEMLATLFICKKNNNLTSTMHGTNDRAT